MGGKPENFDKFGDKFKLTLIQMEKRFVDLETALSETGDKLKDINLDSVTALEKRVDDIEDLIMVEQAGILEIKKMMEAEQQKQKDFIDANVLTKFEDRLNKIDQNLKSLSIQQPSLEAQERIKKLEGDVTSLSVKAPPDLGELHGKISEIQQQLGKLRTALDNQATAFEQRVRDMAARIPEKTGVDFDFANSKMDSLKIGLDILSDKKVETDLKIAGLEEKILILDNKIKESLSQKFLDEIKINKRDIMTTNVRLESAERVLRAITSELHGLSNTVKKFENFERLTLLNKEIEEKLQRFKFIENETSRLSSRMELIYDDLDKRLEVVKSIEKNFGKVSDVVSNLMKEVDRNKIETSQRLKRVDVENMLKEVEQKNIEIEKMFGEFENRIRTITKSQIAQIKKDVEAMNKSMTGLNPQEVSNYLEVMRHEMDKNIMEIKNKVSENNRKAAEIATRVAQSAIEKSFSDKLKWLDNEISKLSKIKEMKQPVDIGNLPQRLANLEGKIAFIEKGVRETQKPNLDVEIEGLVNKLVFLETRLGAMENIMSKTQDMSKMQPIILE